MLALHAADPACILSTDDPNGTARDHSLAQGQEYPLSTSG